MHRCYIPSWSCLIFYLIEHPSWISFLMIYFFYAQVGVLIGKAGDTIRYLQYNSGAKIQITRDADADPHCATRSVELIGSLESIEKAEKLMTAVIAEV